MSANRLFYNNGERSLDAYCVLSTVLCSFSELTHLIPKLTTSWRLSLTSSYRWRNKHRIVNCQSHTCQWTVKLTFSRRPSWPGARTGKVQTNVITSLYVYLHIPPPSSPIRPLQNAHPETFRKTCPRMPDWGSHWRNLFKTMSQEHVLR